MMEKAKAIFQSLFQDIAWIDYRALAACRITLGLTLLYDLIARFPLLAVFYTDSGLFPRRLVGSFSLFQFHMLGGEWCFQAALFAISILLAAFFTIGIMPRVTAILLWMLLISMQERNFMLIHLGDVLGRTLLFWMAFLPIEKKWSISTTIDRSASEGVGDLASFALLLQVLVVYFFTAILKSHPVWNQEFTAIFYSLHLDEYTTPMGRWLLSFPGLLRALTQFSFYLELLGPCILLAAGLQRYVRWLVPFLFIGFHFGIFLTMYISTFPLVCMCAWLLFLPTKFWQRVDDFFISRLFLGKNIRVNFPRAGWWPKIKMSDRVRLIFSSGLLLYCLVGMLFWNARSARLVLWDKVPILFGPLRSIGFEQSWKMYAPAPPLLDGWLAFEGKLSNGSVIDPWTTLETPAWIRPENVYQYEQGIFWRNYFAMTFVHGKSWQQRRLFADYLCSKWRGDGADSRVLSSFKVFYLIESSPPKPDGQVRKMPKGEFICRSSGA